MADGVDDLEIFVSGDGLLGIRFLTGDIADGRLIPYEPLPNDAIASEDRLFRDNVEIGRIVGPDDTFLLTADTFEPSPFDALFTRTNGPDAASDAAIDRLADWSVSVNGEPVAVADLYRKSKIAESAQLDGFQRAFVEEHVIHLDVGRTLADGDVVSITGPGGILAAETATIDTTATRSDAVHVNQVGFAPGDPSKIAVLSTWLGVDTDRPENAQRFENGVDYAPGTAFHVVDVETGERVFSGEIELLVAAETFNTAANGGRPATNLANADTWRMDFSALDDPGTYVVEVEGVGTSYDFEIGDVWGDLFEVGARGFYHQRSGIALEAPYTEWERPRSLSPEDGQVAIQSTLTIVESGNGFIRRPGESELDTFVALEAGSTGEVIEGAWGGWHDAGDWDRRVQHLDASLQMMDLVEIDAGYFEGVDLNIPESGNGIPDVLDEALWTVDLFQRLQKADGGVPGGIEGGTVPDENGDPTGFQYGEASWANSRPLFVFEPDAWSSSLFAASAARAARVVEPYDGARAATYLADAIAAFDWALANPIDPALLADATPEARQEPIDALNLAALELYRTTGDARFEAVFEDTSSFVPPRELAYYEHQIEASWAYLTMDEGLQDAELAATLRADFLGEADAVLASFGIPSGFATADNPFAPYTFSSTGTNPGQAADLLARAHALTGDERYLEGAVDDASFALGMNPDNVSFVSGVGDEQVRELLVADAEALGGTLPPGIVAYGNYDAVGNGARFWHERGAEASYPSNPLNWPGYESWAGFFDAVPITEFTVDEPMGSSTYLWGYLAQLNESADDDAGGGTGGGGNTGGGGGQPPAPNPVPNPTLDAFLAYEVQIGSIVTLVGADGGPTALQLGVGESVDFSDGVSARVVQSGDNIAFVAEDAADAYPWATRTTFGDATGNEAWRSIDILRDEAGARLESTAIYDDGRVYETAYEGGERARTVLADPNDAFRWSRIERAFEDGVIVSAATTFDDGTTGWTNYEAGRPADITLVDGVDVQPWTTIYTTFQGGLREATFRTDDDGVVRVSRFEDGVAVSHVASDDADAYGWASITLDYVDGAAVSRSTLFDDGRVLDVALV